MKQNCMSLFLTGLKHVAHLYNWEVKDGNIIGNAKGKKVKEHTPLTAIVNPQRRAKHKSPLRATESGLAAKELGLNDSETVTIIDAVIGNGNRGYSQVLRGKIKRILGL